MTYRQLLLALQRLNNEQLDCEVSVMDQDEEFYPATLSLYEYEDVLNEDHPYFIPVTNGG
jgi:hypothetical protein